MAEHSRSADNILDSGFLPQRVLDLNFDPSTDDLRLVETQHLHSKKRRPYVTLSHRWGLSQNFRTTQANLPAMRRKISFSELPATFKDAVLVCRSMDVRYLWIDALCISQDDIEDWKAQAVRMGYYYRKSKFTIAAHFASSSSAGFLANVFQPDDTHLDDNHIVCLQGDFFAEVDGSPLTKRGWVLQERLLSNRTLHFTRHHLFGEDSRGFISDDHWTPGSNPGFDMSKDILTLPDDLPAVKPPNPAEAEVEVVRPTRVKQYRVGFENIWALVIERCTGCDLTRLTDKLPAVAGVAKYMQTWSDNARYYAGLWSDSLVPGLIWPATEKPLVRSSDERAPSWSWASTVGRVQFLKSKSVRACLIPEFEMTQIESLDGTSDPCWMNGSAMLTIRTAIKRVESFGWERNTIHPGSVPGRVSGQADFSYENNLFKYKPFIRRVLWKKSGDPWRHRSGGWIVPDEDEERTPYTGEIFSLRLASLPERSDRFFTLFLVSDGTVRRKFKRIGMGQMFKSWFDDASVENVAIV